MMFLGLSDDIHEEKHLFLQFKKNALRTNQPTDGPTDGRTDGRTDRRTDGPTDGYRRTDGLLRTPISDPRATWRSERKPLREP